MIMIDEVGFIEDCEDAVADVGNNADLYFYTPPIPIRRVATDLVTMINEAHSMEVEDGRSSVTLHGSISISRLVLTKRR